MADETSKVASEATRKGRYQKSFFQLLCSLVESFRREIVSSLSAKLCVRSSRCPTQTDLALKPHLYQK
jgi:hypothetical protein